jgi:HEAT repeat protein
MSTPMDDLGQATRALASTTVKTPDAREASDPRPTQDLVNLYLADPETDEAGYALSIMQYRGGPEEFAIASKLALSAEPHKRRVAADILAQLGWQERAYLEESVQILVELLNDQDTDVLRAAAIACGHRHSVVAVERLVALAKHPSENVRYGVAYGLAGKDVASAIDALIQLTKDSDRDVRDWATFALGSQTEVDTTELREALRDRLVDLDPEVRGEALVGLAKRHDHQLKQAILDSLNGEFHGDWMLEAAEIASDPDFVPALERLRATMDRDLPARFFESVDKALLACARKDKEHTRV